MSVIRNLILVGWMILLGASMFFLLFTYLTVSTYLQHYPSGYVPAYEVRNQGSNWIVLGIFSTFSGIFGSLLVGYRVGQHHAKLR
jgi:hypothetical protein